MQLRLLWYKVFLGNVELFLVRVTRKLDDFHSIEQGGGDSRSVVCCRNEHNLAQVKFKLDIAVNERAVLLTVKCFEQS